MTKKKETSEERTERLRQHPAFKELAETLRKQEPDRVNAFLEQCEDEAAAEEEAEIIEVLEQRMRRIAREVCQEMLKSYVPTMPRPKIVMGKGQGRKENRKWRRMTVAIDENLYDYFKAECEFTNLSEGKLLDMILWKRYGEPTLSYQVEKGEES